MLITFGFLERCRSGSKALVTAAIEVMFVLNVELKFSRRSESEVLFGVDAMPALFTSTGFLSDVMPGIPSEIKEIRRTIETAILLLDMLFGGDNRSIVRHVQLYDIKGGSDALFLQLGDGSFS